MRRAPKPRAKAPPKPSKTAASAELAPSVARTSEFDAEMIADTFAPPPDGARNQWERARARVGRPRKGAGARG